MVSSSLNMRRRRCQLSSLPSSALSPTVTNENFEEAVLDIRANLVSADEPTILFELDRVEWYDLLDHFTARLPTLACL